MTTGARLHDGLPEFLRDRYREAEARERRMLEMLAKANPNCGPRLAICFDDGTSGDAFDWNPWDVIDDYDPAHRLADIALKRAILAAYVEAKAAVPPVDDWYEVADGIKIGNAEALEQAVRQFGTEFAGHPAYQSEWAP